jgi:hypothetical protein
MRRIACLCLVLYVGSARAGEDDGFTSLFNGKSLAGWTRFGGKPSTWEVEDGRLVCLGEGGGWLGSERDYADFDLRLEFRVTSGSNSGVYLRAPAETSHISRTGLEIQILDETHPSHATIKPWQKTGAIYHVRAPEPGHQRPVGVWNRMEIRAEGPHVVIRLNGTTIVNDRLDNHPDLTAEHPGLARAAGRIGLQSHNGRVEFRDIRIKDLRRVQK